MHPTTPQTAPTPGRQATAREFLAVLFRRKWIILGLFLVTTATVVTVAIMTPTYFVSSGRILVKRGERQTILRPAVGRRPSGCSQALRYPSHGPWRPGSERWLELRRQPPAHSGWTSSPA